MMKKFAAFLTLLAVGAFAAGSITTISGCQQDKDKPKNGAPKDGAPKDQADEPPPPPNGDEPPPGGKQPPPKEKEDV